MAATADYYAVLGVSPESEDIVIPAAYRALMRRYHPDKNPSAEAARKTLEINAAYAVLGDPSARAAYDARRRAQASDKKAKSHTHAKTPPPPPPRQPSGGGIKDAGYPPKFWADGPGKPVAVILLVGFVLGVIGLASGNGSAPSSLNTMNIDENLTTTDTTPLNLDAADTSATDMNATDINATAAQASPDLSKLTQTVVSYDTIEAAADRGAKIIVTKGVSGARAYSEGCHKTVQATPSWNAADSCAAFDYAAAYIDAAVSTQNGWQKDGYFQFQSDNQPDDYAAIGAPSYATSDRLAKIRTAAQGAAIDALRMELARRRAEQPSQSTAAATPITDNSSE
jgi:hypothetical protein